MTQDAVKMNASHSEHAQFVSEWKGLLSMANMKTMETDWGHWKNLTFFLFWASLVAFNIYEINK